MKKIGILTINDNGNYGNRLQNYAVQHVLEEKGFDVNTISNQKNNHSVIFMFKNLIKLLMPNNKGNRYRNFVKFNKNIKYSKIHIDEDHISTKLNELYDCFFSGSDQVWNPTFGRMSDIDFLTFADENKRFSFSASFGVTKIPEEKKEYYKDRLEKFKCISVREDAGKKIVEDLTGRKDVVVLIDPTMLLSSEEWDKLSKMPKQIEKLKIKKYILNYFLGDLSDKRYKEIEKIAQENGCEIINLLDKNSPFYSSGPSEFLWLEKNAFLICTDSFHSSVFAIIYNRPFIIFDREGQEQNMNSRLETLISKFHLKDRKYNEKNITHNNLNHDYSDAYKILKKEKDKSNAFLRNVLNIKEGE